MYKALFARVHIIGQQRNIQLLSVFQYKLSLVPHSLVDEFGYAKDDTSVLMKRLRSDSENVPKPNVLLVDHTVCERQEQWQTLWTVARHASQVVKSTKVQLSLLSLLNWPMKD